MPRELPHADEMPVGVVAQTRIASALAVVRREIPAARLGRVVGVHQLRVATRRLRAALALFEPVLSRRTVESLDDDLQWLGRMIGPVRDLDVLAATLARRDRERDAEDDFSLASVTRHARERRKAMHGILVDALDGVRVRRLVVRVAALAGSPPRPAGRAAFGSEVSALVRPLVRAVERAGRHADDAAKPETLHRLRVRVKRLRYALESLDGGGDDATRKLARRLAKLQDRLGRHHDAVSQRAWLRREVPVFAAEPDTLLAVGMEVERLARRARKLERRMPKWLKKALRPKLVAAAFDELAAPGAHGAAA